MAQPARVAGSRGRRVVAASAWVTIGMLAGRLAGMAREFLIADTFGVSRSADLAILLVTGPDVLATIAGTGAVGLVLIPILLDHDVENQLRLTRSLVARLAGLAVLVAAAAVGLMLLFATDWATGSELDGTAFRTAIMLTALAVPPSMVVVVTGAFLRAQDRFAIVSFGTVVFTIPVLVAIVSFRSVIGVAAGISAGAFLRYVAQEAVIRWRWPGPARTPAQEHEAPLAELRSADLGTSFAISVLLAAQVSLPLLIVALVGNPGEVALLNYGWRILLIPVGLLGSVFSVAAYPTIVRHLQAETAPTARQAISSIVRPVVVLSLIVGAWLLVNASSAIRAVYRPADLTEDAITTISDGVRVGAVAVPLLTLGTAATSVAFGLKRSRLGLVPYLSATAVLALLGVVLTVTDGPLGMMWAVTISAAVLCVSSAQMLYRATGFAIAGRSDFGLLAAASVSSVVLALALRLLIPSDNLLGISLSGVVYVIGCSLGILAFERKSGAF